MADARSKANSGEGRCTIKPPTIRVYSEENEQIIGESKGKNTGLRHSRKGLQILASSNVSTQPLQALRKSKIPIRAKSEPEDDYQYSLSSVTCEDLPGGKKPGTSKELEAANIKRSDLKADKTRTNSSSSVKSWQSGECKASSKPSRPIKEIETTKKASNKSKEIIKKVLPGSRHEACLRPRSPAPFEKKVQRPATSTSMVSTRGAKKKVPRPEQATRFPLNVMGARRCTSADRAGLAESALAESRNKQSTKANVRCRSVRRSGSVDSMNFLVPKRKSNPKLQISSRTITMPHDVNTAAIDIEDNLADGNRTQLLPLEQKGTYNEQDELQTTPTNVKRGHNVPVSFKRDLMNLLYHLEYANDLLHDEIEKEGMSHKLSINYIGKNINANQRTIIVGFLMRFCTHFSYPSVIQYQAIRLFDAAMDVITVKTKYMQLYAIAALWIILKKEYLHDKVPSAEKMISFANDAYEGRTRLLTCSEQHILTALQFNLPFSDPFSIIGYYVRNIQTQSTIADCLAEKMYYCSSYVVDISLLSAEFCYVGAHLVATVATELAACLVLETNANFHKSDWKFWRYLITKGLYWGRYKDHDCDILRARMIQMIMGSSRKNLATHRVYQKYKLRRYGEISYFIVKEIEKLSAREWILV